jgi:F0F1-type ATP synthase epsilon subunit
MMIRKPIALPALPALIGAALALSASTAWAQRPMPIRIIPVAPAPAPAAQPATNPPLQMPKGPIFSAADPLELLKQVNILRGQVAALQQQTATLQGQVGAQAHMIDSLKNGLATVSLKGIANTNDLVAVNGGLTSLQGELAKVKGDLGNVKSELGTVKSDAATLKSNFDSHGHYHKFAYDLNGQQKIDAMLTSGPSVYCKKTKDGNSWVCDQPQ